MEHHTAASLGRDLHLPDSGRCSSPSQYYGSQDSTEETCKLTYTISEFSMVLGRSDSARGRRDGVPHFTGKGPTRNRVMFTTKP